MSTEAVQQNKARALRLAELQGLEPIKFDELQKAFDKWMILPDRNVVKLLAAVYCANELSQRPIWLILVAPSGGGKTELLNSLLELEKIHPLSLLTPTTFLSGMGKAASLLPKLTGKIMIVKDWTSILSMQKDARAEIFSQFREIYDGAMVKEFGNGKRVNWSGKISLLAASTEAVDMSQQQLAHLGERFLFYRPVLPPRKEVGKRSLENSSKQEKMLFELQNAMYSFIKGVDFKKFKTLPALDAKVQSELVDLANFCTMARSTVIRDFGFKKEVIFVPSPEMPTRILQQLSLLGSGIMIVNGGTLDDKDIGMLYKVALDSIPKTNKMVISELAKEDNQPTSEIATALGYPTDTIRTYLENLAMLGVCTRYKESGRSDRWTMDPEFVEIMRRYESIQKLTEEEKEERRKAAMTGDALDAEEQWNQVP